VNALNKEHLGAVVADSGSVVDRARTSVKWSGVALFVVLLLGYAAALAIHFSGVHNDDDDDGRHDHSDDFGYELEHEGDDDGEYDIFTHVRGVCYTVFVGRVCDVLCVRRYSVTPAGGYEVKYEGRRGRFPNMFISRSLRAHKLSNKTKPPNQTIKQHSLGLVQRDAWRVGCSGRHRRRRIAAHAIVTARVALSHDGSGHVGVRSATQCDAIQSRSTSFKPHRAGSFLGHAAALDALLPIFFALTAALRAFRRRRRRRRRCRANAANAAFVVVVDVVSLRHVPLQSAPSRFLARAPVATSVSRRLAARRYDKNVWPSLCPLFLSFTNPDPTQITWLELLLQG
jgi:hypothetical protein